MNFPDQNVALQTGHMFAHVTKIMTLMGFKKVGKKQKGQSSRVLSRLTEEDIKTILGSLENIMDENFDWVPNLYASKLQKYFVLIVPLFRKNICQCWKNRLEFHGRELMKWK